MIRAIVAVDVNNAIGKNNELLFKIPEYTEFFEKVTSNHVLVMGRKTYDAIGKPLPMRTNLVITKNAHGSDGTRDLYFGGIEFIHVMMSIFDTNKQDVYIIGGESIFKTFIRSCEEIYLARYYKAYTNPDAYFPYIESLGYKMIEVISNGIYDGCEYEIQRWVLKE